MKLLRMLARESRGARGRLVFFSACLATGVAAVVLVAGLSSGLQEAVRLQARDLLAADLAVESREPLPAGFEAELGARRTEVVELTTLAARVPRDAAAPEPGELRSRLVELRAVDGEYPFYGKLELRPQRPLAELLAPDTAVCARELLLGLGLAVGDELLLAGERFRIAGEVLSEPDRLAVGFTLGPRVFLSRAGLDRTPLLGRGSRVQHRALLELPAAGEPGLSDPALAAARLRRTLPDARIETAAQGQPAMRRGIERAESFLGLVALLSLLVGGIGVAQTVRSWMVERQEPIAVLKCLGMRPREVLRLYLVQTLLLALGGSLLGALVGQVAQIGLPGLIAELPPGFVRPWQPAALLRGLALGVGVAALFALPPLLSVLRVPPSLVLRRDTRALAVRPLLRAATLLVVSGGVFGAAWLQSDSLERASAFVGGLLVAAALLAGAARLLVWLAARAPRRALPVGLRYGVAALARPQAGTRGAVLALGLGVLVVLALHLVRTGLVRELRNALPADSPTTFLADIQAGQWEEVRGKLADAGAEGIDSVPVVTARLSAIDGVAVSALLGRRERAAASGAGEGEAAAGEPGAGQGRGGATGGGGEGREPEPGRRRARWVLTREQRLTWRETLPPDNELLESTTPGAPWGDPERAEISLEEDYAEDLGVGLGAVLRFDVQGVPFDLTVSSLRRVNWGSFRINFFLLVEPGVLEDAPQMRIAAARLSDEAGQALQDELALVAPNVTVIQVHAVIATVRAALERIGLGVSVLGGVTVVAGLVILAGAVSASALRRSRETALLRALGFTGRGVALVHAVEDALVGLLAGSIGAAGGALLAWAMLDQVLELPFRPGAAALLAAPLAAAALAAVAGALTGRRARSAPPLEVLRA